MPLHEPTESYSRIDSTVALSVQNRSFSRHRMKPLPGRQGSLHLSLLHAGEDAKH